MRLSSCIIASLQVFLFAEGVSSFVHTAFQAGTLSSNVDSFGSCDRLVCGSSRLNMVDLVAEPEGGEELTQLKTVTGMRMKNMGAVEGVTGKSGGQAFGFWMTATAPGVLVKEFRTKIMKDASKNANFPGFRKGQVPPYALPKMTGFALQEAIIATVEAAVGAYGLMALDGSDGEVEVKEDVQEIVKIYKLGDDVSFTATLKCEFDSTKQGSGETADKIEEAEEEVEATA